jgi:hypothetical protein
MRLRMSMESTIFDLIRTKTCSFGLGPVSKNVILIPLRDIDTTRSEDD